MDPLAPLLELLGPLKGILASMGSVDSAHPTMALVDILALTVDTLAVVRQAPTVGPSMVLLPLGELLATPLVPDIHLDRIVIRPEDQDIHRRDLHSRIIIQVVLDIHPVRVDHPSLVAILADPLDLLCQLLDLRMHLRALQLLVQPHLAPVHPALLQLLHLVRVLPPLLRLLFLQLLSTLVLQHLKATHLLLLPHNPVEHLLLTPDPQMLLPLTILPLNLLRADLVLIQAIHPVDIQDMGELQDMAEVEPHQDQVRIQGVPLHKDIHHTQDIQDQATIHQVDIHHQDLVDIKAMVDTRDTRLAVDTTGLLVALQWDLEVDIQEDMIKVAMVLKVELLDPKDLLEGLPGRLPLSNAHFLV